ncbi:siderophore-interacting protein [Psychrobacter sp. NG27]|uniref:siderophore-interacting protein n=1 Tax=Psychrobacter sp. NG27 TaxID=2781966 RepID=UPI0018DF0420|nr:siderophore-interacting protein [Psychrobacter sp. NG27]MBI0426489.1 SIP domain-containing protein [Psychrobacter sp. NG27]
MANILLPTENLLYKQNNSYTLLDAPEIDDIIAHINEEHLDELLGFLSAFTSIPTAELNHVDAQITAIYAEGIALQTYPKHLEQPLVSQDNNLRDQAFFITFAAPITHPDDLQTQYILLKQRADKKLGKKTIKLTKQVFEVRSSYNVSKNMLRLELSMPSLNDAQLNDDVQLRNTNGALSSISVPINEAGYAYLFDLEHNATTKALMTDSIDENKADDDAVNDNEKNNVRSTRPHCYYTLRKAWHTDDGIRAWVDVFLHGDTPGGNWAQSLQAGDTIVTKREFPEKVEHLRDGQAVLIVDETSMPTAARLLELWNNPKPPLIICVTQDIADQSYFDDVKIRSRVSSSDCIEGVDSTKGMKTVLHITANQTSLGQDLATVIDDKLSDYVSRHAIQIDKVWGALEASTVKAVRDKLRARFDLSRADVIVKAYWRHTA